MKVKTFLYMALGFLLINLFATTWLYPVLFEVFNHGRTLAKMAAKLCIARQWQPHRLVCFHAAQFAEGI